jgi:hypothetical protein
MDRCFNEADTCAPGQEKFRNLPAIWNDYAAGYRSLPNTYIVRYEDLVVHPRESVAAIAAYLSDPLVEDLDVGLAKAKQMSSGSLDEIRQKVVERLYLKQYGKKELVEVCELLDRELMKHFRYTDCESVLDGR